MNKQARLSCVLVCVCVWNKAAGFGFVAARGGEGSDHRRGERIYEVCGPVSGATPFVKTTTNNVAELVAFTRALTWALVDPRAAAATNRR